MFAGIVYCHIAGRCSRVQLHEAWRPLATLLKARCGCRVRQVLAIVHWRSVRFCMHCSRQRRWVGPPRRSVTA